ncbi:hypothetical protein OAG1_04530 [Agarivorans sp. OAG1]|uniref:Lacal_2735 family protein n=2 Tax=Agarivorans TaxID=261825 RepID=R9PM26_AGAAL|nr:MULTISPECIES: DUF6435 family protein [Agarivorans]MPW31548.1 Lacal_2735 family protein [Agarivorans sp. B2Z047]UQN42591.1 DUF6435 family protein [Agarivorans sp. B2Z047]BEU01653.1 hypothetical protein OAG1_04530 [Agarivorans sp. OAG1]GAD02313.1 hypothetical protein AALB_2393 [Agarivorans albus MKT 106]
MFSFLKPNPLKRKRQKYDALLESAMLAQRRGDIMTYSMLSADADELWKEIEQLESQQK